MEVFQELVVRGEPRQISATADAICKLVSGNWSRDVVAENMLSKWDAGGRTLCFDRLGDDSLQGAALFLTQRDGTLTVTNVVPEKAGRLSYSEYNALLGEFVDQFIRPAATQTGVQVELSQPQADLERWLTPEASAKLRTFCLVANKRTGASHPTDKRLWYDFVVAAHRSESTLDSSTLARWLHEAGGWDEEWAEELAIQYEQARGLLEYADHQAVGA